jgi:hypothetical protein
MARSGDSNTSQITLMTALKAMNTMILDSKLRVQTVPMAQAIKKASSKNSK